MLSARFSDALAYATGRHARQVRKGTRIPYISHLLAVASIALEHGANEDEAIAALLHDAVDEQAGPGALEQIRERFGGTVAAIVEGSTDALTAPESPSQSRKDAYIARIRRASPSVCLICAADKLHNVRSILSDYRVAGDSLWQRFRGGREGTLLYYRELVKALRAAKPCPLVEELDLAVGELAKLSGGR